MFCIGPGGLGGGGGGMFQNKPLGGGQSTKHLSFY